MPHMIRRLPHGAPPRLPPYGCQPMTMGPLKDELVHSLSRMKWIANHPERPFQYHTDLLRKQWGQAPWPISPQLLFNDFQCSGPRRLASFNPVGDRPISTAYIPRCHTRQEPHIGDNVGPHGLMRRWQISTAHIPRCSTRQEQHTGDNVGQH